MSEQEDRIREQMEACNVTPLRSEKRMIKCKFSIMEMDEIAANLAKHTLEGLRLENEKKAVTKTLGDQQKEEESQAQAFAKLYKDGFEEREKGVLIGIDASLNIRHIVDIETGCEIGTELMRDGDLQTSLNLKAAAAAAPAKKAKKAPTAPGPLEVGYEKDRPSRNAVEVEGIILDSANVAQNIETAFANEPEAIEEATIVTQIRMLEERHHCPGIIFATSADKIPQIFFTDKLEVIEDLKTAHENHAYLAIKFMDVKDAVNLQIIDVEYRDLSPTLEDDPGEEVGVPDGFEVGDPIE